MPEQRVMPIHSTPSLKTGFARSAREAKYPQLWNGLIGAWTGLGHTGTRAIDFSGNGHHGTSSNLTWTRSEGSYCIDTTGASAYEIDCGDIPDMGDGIVEFSYSWWFWLDAVPTTSVQYYLEKNGNELNSYFHSNNLFYTWLGSDFGSLDYTTLVSAKSWFNVVRTFNGGATTKTRVYFDGVEVAETSPSVQTTLDLAGDVLEICGRSGNTDLKAKHDDIRFYNRVLTDGEIRLLSRRRNVAYERKHRTYSIASAAAPAARNRVIMIS